MTKRNDCLSFVFFVVVCRRVRDAAGPAWAGGGRDAGVPLPSPLLPVGSRPKGGHAGRRRSHPGEAGRQEDPSRLPANDYQAGQRHHGHQQLEPADANELKLYIVTSDNTHEESNPQTPKYTIMDRFLKSHTIISNPLDFLEDCPSLRPRTPHQEALVEFTLSVNHQQNIEERKHIAGPHFVHRGAPSQCSVSGERECDGNDYSRLLAVVPPTVY